VTTISGTGGFELIIVMLWLVAVTAVWLFLSRGASRDNRRPPIVGVQKHGRIYYVRKDVLDASEALSQPNRSTSRAWPGQVSGRGEQTGRDQRQRVVRTIILMAIASLVAGVVLTGQ